MEKAKVIRTTVPLTSDLFKVIQRLKHKGYNLSQVSEKAIREAIETGMPIPDSSRTSGVIDKEAIGVSIPAELNDALNNLTRPTLSKAAYIREAIKLWASKNLKK